MQKRQNAPIVTVLLIISLGKTKALAVISVINVIVHLQNIQAPWISGIHKKELIPEFLRTMQRLTSETNL